VSTLSVSSTRRLLRLLAVSQQAQVFEDGERVARRRAKESCRPVWKGDRFERICEQQTEILFDDIVYDKDDQLSQCPHRGQDDDPPRLAQLENTIAGPAAPRGHIPRQSSVRTREKKRGAQA